MAFCAKTQPSSRGTSHRDTRGENRPRNERKMDYRIGHPFPFPFDWRSISVPCRSMPFQGVHTVSRARLSQYISFFSTLTLHIHWNTDSMLTNGRWNAAEPPGYPVLVFVPGVPTVPGIQLFLLFHRESARRVPFYAGSGEG